MNAPKAAEFTGVHLLDRRLQMPFRFLDLPGELRNRIYHFCLRDTVSVQERNHSDGIQRPFLALAHVSQQLRKEFFDLYHQHTTIRLSQQTLDGYLMKHYPDHWINQDHRGGYSGTYIVDITMEGLDDAWTPDLDLLAPLRVANASPDLVISFAGPDNFAELMEPAVNASRKAGWLEFTGVYGGPSFIEVFTESREIVVFWEAFPEDEEEDEEEQEEINETLLAVLGMKSGEHWKVSVERYVITESGRAGRW